jgi:hypothetical protein
MMINFLEGKVMNKFAVLLLIGFALVTAPGLRSNAETHKNQTALATPTPKPKSGTEIEKIELDRNEVIIPCPPGMQQSKEKACDGDNLIKIKTSAVNPRAALLVYYYTVSGGRIIGKGAEVSWDLSGVRPGTYTVTAAVGEESESITKTQTATVEVRQCKCIYVDACPVITVSPSPETVKAGESVDFSASVSGKSNANLTYNWSVSAGEITEGQGTPRIKVKTTPEMADTNLTASVEISGDAVASICQTSAAATVSIKK